MAWEWVSPVVSGVVGLGGLTFGWRIAAGGRRHEVAQWHRERRADAYVELLEVAEDVGHVVAVVFPLLDRDPPQPVPDLPTGERQGRARARVAAFGSPKVKAAAERWREAATTGLRAAEAVARDEDDARRLLDEARTAEREAREHLNHTIEADLRP
jgi:hypothetical protein